MLVNGQKGLCVVIRSLFKLAPKSFDMTLVDGDSFFICYLAPLGGLFLVCSFLAPCLQQALILCSEKQYIKTTRWTGAISDYRVGHDWQFERTSFDVHGNACVALFVVVLRFKKCILHSYRHLCISGFFKSCRKSLLVTHIVKSLMY